MLKVILIDDEPSAIKVLKSTLESLDNIEIIGTYTSSIEGIDAILAQQPDIVFLDIEMPIYNGLDVAKKIEKIDCHLVYVTAYPEHALSAFETDVTDYLLKPVRPSRLVQCIKKINKRVKPISSYPMLSVFDGSTTYNLNSEHINFIESLGRYQQIHLTSEGSQAFGQERIIVEQSISIFEEKLQHSDFYRVHRGYIVRLSRISKTISQNRNKFIKLIGFDENIPVSRSKYKEMSEQNLI